ncbi:hypothetical protein [Pseudomonas huanghezhanensis]
MLQSPTNDYTQRLIEVVPEMREGWLVQITG